MHHYLFASVIAPDRAGQASQVALCVEAHGGRAVNLSAAVFGELSFICVHVQADTQATLAEIWRGLEMLPASPVLQGAKIHIERCSGAFVVGRDLDRTVCVEVMRRSPGPSVVGDLARVIGDNGLSIVYMYGIYAEIRGETYYVANVRVRVGLPGDIAVGSAIPRLIEELREAGFDANPVPDGLKEGK